MVQSSIYKHGPLLRTGNPVVQLFGRFIMLLLFRSIHPVYKATSATINVPRLVNGRMSHEAQLPPLALKTSLYCLLFKRSFCYEKTTGSVNEILSVELCLPLFNQTGAQHERFVVMPIHTHGRCR